MVVAKSTAERIVEIVVKYVPQQQVLPMLEELSEVPGNKSFRDTVTRMQTIYNRGGKFI